MRTMGAPICMRTIGGSDMYAYDWWPRYVCVRLVAPICMRTIGGSDMYAREW